MKKIDKLLVGNFLPPFVVTFFIAQFVLVMQTLWVYIDDIAGKGVGFFLMVELLSYMSVSMIPMALPIAVLISSVMVLGNMAERYELSSFKSAGVPLWRVMMPLMLVAFVISGLSFLCSNNLIPISNLKFKSRLYDIRKQKPTLSLEEGMFNDDFKGYSIRIGKKEGDDRTIKDVLLYDHNEANQGRLVSVVAEEGEMYATKDEAYFIMELKNGHQYSEPNRTKKEEGEMTTPFIRTSFQEWYKIFDLNEFEINRTDERLFKSHHSMLSSRQLALAIDSIDRKVADRIKTMGTTSDKYFYFFDKKNRAELKRKAAEEREKQREKKAAEEKLKRQEAEKTPKKTKKKSDLEKELEKQNKTESDAKKPVKKNRTPPKKTPAKPSKPKKKTEKKPSKKSDKKKSAFKPKREIKQIIDKPLNEYTSFAETLPKDKLPALYDKAKTFARAVNSQADSAIRANERVQESRVKHVFEFNSKFSMAIACLIFLFIGAPMGAIVKKGGFGYPLLISIIFFMLFVVMTIFCKNIAERFVIDAVLAAWVPCLVIFPIGLFLTWQAINDATWQKIAKYINIVRWILKLIRFGI